MTAISMGLDITKHGLRTVDYSDVIERIRTNDALRRHTEKLRSITDEEAQQSYKKSLPFISTSIFKDGIRRNKNFLKSDLIHFDIDHLNGNLETTRAALENDPSVCAVFTSARGNGLKVFFLLAETVTDEKTFFNTWLAQAAEINRVYNIEVDQSCKDTARGCFLSHDPAAFYNEQSDPIPVLHEAESGAEQKKKTPVSDLYTGAPKGERLTGLVRIIGKAIYDRRGDEEIRMLALGFGARCKPPMDEAEILKTAESLLKAHPVTVSEGTFSEELIKQYGEPYYLNKQGEVAKINESFWAGKNHSENIQLYEPDERSFYRYAPATGLYEIVTQDIIKLEISNSILDVSRKPGPRSLEKMRTSANMNSAVSHLRGIAEKRNAFHKTSNFVHLENGVIVFNNERQGADFCEFSHEFFSRNRCPIPFKQEATCERFLSELILPAVSADDAVLLQKYFGMCLLGNNLSQQLLILDGEAARGKSTLVKIAQSIIGQENVSELRTRQLNERFELYRYLKKTLLVGVDVPGSFLNEKGAQVLKGLVGGDWFDAEQKGGTGCFPVQGNFCVLITSNSRLHVRLDGDTGAWKRRLLIIRFEGPKPVKKIPDFDKILIRDEGSGILNWCLQGLKMLLDDIENLGDINLTLHQAGVVEGLLAESDSLSHFLIDCVQKSEQDELSSTEIIEKYAEYCPKMGWNPKPITIIQRELEGLMLSLFGTAKSHGIQRDGKTNRGFRHVSFKNAGAAA